MSEIPQNAFIGFGLSFILSLFLTPLFIKIGYFFKVAQPPKERDIHWQFIPRIGGLALLTSFVVTSLLLLPFNEKIWAIIFASIFIVLTIFFDDLWGISWKVKLVFQVLSGLILVIFGIVIESVTNPFDGIWSLFIHDFSFSFLSKEIVIYPLAAVLTVFWVVFLQNVLNFLDGLDGLASGVSVIGFGVLALVAYYVNIYDPNIFIFLLILIGAILGFLPYNFNPAKVFLGDSGAYFLGLTLAAVSILVSGKIAIAVLVLGVPILDAIWVIFKRILSKRSPFDGDRSHLHFRLLDLGLPQRKIVVSYYIFTLILGISAFLFRDNILVILGFFVFLTVNFAFISALVSNQVAQQNNKNKNS